jgi:hypothetical protein
MNKKLRELYSSRNIGSPSSSFKGLQLLVAAKLENHCCESLYQNVSFTKAQHFVAVLLLATPAFPEYPSGHSVQSAAAAIVLTNLFGDNFSFTDHTHDRHDLQARTFASFNDAAEEAALSRLYGGIHFRTAIENGLVQGRCIGESVLGLEFWQ